MTCLPQVTSPLFPFSLMSTIVATPEAEINEDSCLEDVKRQIEEVRVEKRRLELQIEQMQEENSERIEALEESLRVVMETVVGLRERLKQEG